MVRATDENSCGVKALADTPLPRVRLENVRQIRRELAHLYREGKNGTRAVTDVSKLANVLQIMANLIRDADLETRLEALEKALAKDHPA
jgi:hypothetical protein